MTREIHWVRSWPESGVPRFRIGRRDSELVAEWEGVGILYASADGSRWEFAPAPGVSLERQNKLERGMIQALIRHVQGGMTLHASGVSLGDAALAFLGGAGAGKSTFAAACARDHGVTLLADDTLPLWVEADGVRGARADGASWLDGQAREALGRVGGPREKVPLPWEASPDGAPTLRALVELCIDDAYREAVLHPVKGADAFSLIVRQVFRFTLDDHEILTAEFDTVAAVAERVPVFRLCAPLGFEHLYATTAHALSLLRMP